MNASFRTQIIIGTVTLVCLLLVGASLVLLRQIGPGPASLLPADRTLMLVTNLSPQQQQTLQTIFPSLTDAPLQEQGTPVAALVRSGTQMSWVTFDASGKANTNTPLLVEGERPLSADRAYAQLRSTYTADSPWLFIRFPDVPLQIEGLVQPSSPIAVSFGTGSVQVAWSTRMENGFTGPVSDQSDATVLRLNAGNLASFIRDAAHLLADSNRLAAETLLRSWITRTAGDDFSAVYDLLPMLDGAGTVVMERMANGTSAIALRALPRSDQEERFNRLEQGVRSAETGIERIQRTFDDTFTFDTVKIAEGTQPTQTETIGAWDVSISPTAMTGRNGREWAFGTERSLFTALIRAMHSTAARHIADGTIDPAAIGEMLNRWQIRLNLPWHLLPNTAGDVFWHLERQGGLAVLRLSR